MKIASVPLQVNQETLIADAGGDIGHHKPWFFDADGTYYEAKKHSLWSA